MQRRTALLAAGPLWATGAWATAQRDAAAPHTAPAEAIERLATAFRQAPPNAGPDDGHHVGLLQVDWAAGQVQLEARVPVPSRAHGLLALADGGFVAIANKPGRWLMRLDAQGRVLRLHELDAEQPRRTLNGHAVVSADGRWLYTTETDPVSDTGWLGVRDAHTLQRVAQFSSHGIDPHQLLWAPDGTLVVANGGILRDGLARKRKGEPMTPRLVRLSSQSGRLLGGWTLPDPQLSFRHIAWSADGLRLGIGLQAEHEDLAQRAQSPALAVWDGQTLRTPSSDPRAAGYAGDIAAGPGGGFVISAQKSGLALWWHPGDPTACTVVAQITEPCALVASADKASVSIGGGRGLARWHRQDPPRMVRWPLPLAPDNHAVRLLPQA
jgi:hypothetical protein